VARGSDARPLAPHREPPAAGRVVVVPRYILEAGMALAGQPPGLIYLIRPGQPPL